MLAKAKEVDRAEIQSPKVAKILEIAFGQPKEETTTKEREQNEQTQENQDCVMEEEKDFQNIINGLEMSELEEG